ncbi:hypothetical protein FACS1894125_1640 [Actinomycetota bacterium]|nr:hypothetical protein FACS1894125_1640 [Actinomycetota bacterium]
MDNTQRFLIESITSEVASYVVEDNDVSLAQALELFYNSKLPALLEDTSNGLYREGSAYLYEKFIKEGS